MGYNSGMLDKRVAILNRKAATAGRYGVDSAGAEWEEACEVWASVSYAKGMRALNAGSLDVYASALVRMRWNDKVTRRSRIRYDGATYAILGETFHADRRAGTIQFNMQEVTKGEG